MKVLWSNWAFAQLNESYDHLLKHAGIRVAESLARDVQEGIALLKQFPRGGQLEPWLEHKGLGHRRLVLGNYKVIYRVVGDELRITDFFDVRQDPRNDGRIGMLAMVSQIVIPSLRLTWPHGKVREQGGAARGERAYRAPHRAVAR